MSMFRASVIVVAGLMLAGCASTAVTQAKRDRFVRTIPTCHTDRECELKWAAARRWVLDNSGFKIQHITSDFIETYNPGEYSPQLAARVVKEPLVGGGYRIIATLWCNNLFGCIPDKWEAALDFNAYVNAADPSSSGRTFVSLPPGKGKSASSSSYGGIGILLDSDFSFASLVPGGPAEKAGLEVGDRLVRVDGNDVQGMTMDVLVPLIKGEPGTDVRVTVERNGHELEFDLQRALLD